MPLLGLKKSQSDANSRALSAGSPCATGLVLAALQNGMNENFRGKKLLAVDGVTYSFTTVDGDLDPYYVIGTEQFFAMRSSDATPDANGGLIVASASNPEVCRLTCRDVNAANALSLTQEGALWIPPNQAWTAQFEAYVPSNAYAVGVAFQEMGLMGVGSVGTHFIDASKEFGYVDGSADSAFVSLKFFGGMGYLRVRAAAGGTVQTSAGFVIPSGKNSYRIEYGYSATGGTPTLSLYINDVYKVSVVATMTGGLQFAARACHGASYVAATHTPPVFDLVNLLVAIHS